ncbi:carbohydrate porin [Massilia sp. PAMC28688]|uniref:outer membrane beta-barrel protein n=1 Tax=Massilia sp. PAMC28688 TaxID=2861283 RepID=UPI001C62A0BA|nr:outer membrane beta-barrel protein [Massilia sp. PAMC28688]QYF92327.1 carbohydrate porin [Massilia sp. PAMC28688]
MKKIAVAAFALALASMSAHAQTYVLVEPKPYRFLAGAGLTFGGDRLATAEFEDGGEIDIRAGSMVALYAGAEFAVNDQMALQANIGYHVDSATAYNGDIRFGRYPVELLGYYKVSPQWRIGGGARFVNSPKLSSSGAGDIGDFEFKNSTGLVLEGEYSINPSLGVKVRYVSEKYETRDFVSKHDGNHVGVLLNYYF